MTEWGGGQEEPQCPLFCPFLAPDPGDPGVACGGGQSVMRAWYYIETIFPTTVSDYFCLNLTMNLYCKEKLLQILVTAEN